VEVDLEIVIVDDGSTFLSISPTTSINRPSSFAALSTLDDAE